MAEEILAAYGPQLADVTIIPSSGGRFVITAGGKPVFSKKEAGRFPDEGEVQRLLSKVLPA